MEKEDVVPQASLEAEINLKSLVNFSSKRMVINPNLANRYEDIPKIAKDRESDFIIVDGKEDSDRITYHLPQGYKPEFLFQPVKIASKFGSYESGLNFYDQQLIYSRIFKINEGRFPPEDYGNYVAFLQEVAKADLARVVLVQE